MDGFIGRYATYIYAIFRIVFGFLFMLNGTQKLFGWPPPEKPTTIVGMFVVAGVIELIGGFLVMIGFFSSFAAFIASGMLAVGYFIVHQPAGALPIMNGGERAVLYCFAFLYIASRGSGVWSIDSIFRSGGRPNL